MMLCKRVPDNNEISHTVSGQYWAMIAIKVRGGPERNNFFEEGLIGHMTGTGTFARVKQERALTINLLNYESARVTIGVDVPCLADDESIREKVKWAGEFVESELQKITSEVQEGRKARLSNRS